MIFAMRIKKDFTQEKGRKKKKKWKILKLRKKGGWKY